MNNKYESNFYEYDKEKSIAGYKKDYWLKELKKKLDRCEQYFLDSTKTEIVENDLQVLYNEIKDNFLKFSEVEKLNSEDFNSEVAKELRGYFEKMEKHYVRKYNEISKKLDLAKNKMMGRSQGEKDKFIRLQNENTNKQLSDFVTKNNEFDKVIEVDGILVQQVDPVFLDPHIKRSGNIRAHFYAPRKIFLGSLYSTFWVNIIVIWVMSAILAVTLYFNLFKKFLDAMENLVEKMVPSKKKAD